MSFRLKNRISGLAILLLILPACNSHHQPNIKADLVVTGKIWTGNQSKPWAEAIAISGDTILAVGTRDELQELIKGAVKVISAPDSGLITPGFFDSHTHFLEGGFMLGSIQLREAKTQAEFISTIGNYANKLKPGEWIVGGNWDHQLWGGMLPERSWIDSVTPNNPLWINRLDGHMSLANSAALKAAGIADQTKDTAGGTIVRKNGHITGLLKDNAMFFVERHVPSPNAQQEDVALDAAMKYVSSNGVTSVVVLTATGANDFFEVFHRAHDAHRLNTRIYAATFLERWDSLAKRIQRTGKGDQWLSIGAVKGFVDGGLGAHTAAFNKPYSDVPNDSGFFVIKTEDLHRMVKAADSAGIQVIVHAIGDKAVHTLLDVYERVEAENGPRDRRFRMEHAQHIDPSDYPRFAALHVIPSMQPYHAIDDGRWAEKYIGHERARSTYAFRSLLDAKAKLAFGSDWSVAPASPMEGIYAAVTRRTIDGNNPGGWIPEQKITVQEALKAYTTTAAYAIFQEKSRGSLEPGKLADMVILEKDITAIDPIEIKDVKIIKTFVGGREVYSHR